MGARTVRASAVRGSICRILQNVRILVVDDNPGVLKTISILLVHAGYDVIVAEDGFAALSQLKKTLPLVIISDLEMPCLRTFQLAVIEEMTGQVLEVPCRFCPGKNRYVIEPSSQPPREACA